MMSIFLHPLLCPPGSSKRGETDWFSLVVKWLRSSFPATRVISHNGCLPATPASYMTMCLEHHMEKEVDLVRGPGGKGGEEDLGRAGESRAGGAAPGWGERGPFCDDWSK